MKRSRQKIDNIRQKRASLVDKEGNEKGRYSEIEGIIANNPRKVRGDRVERLVYEEAGSAPTLIKSWVQGTALVELGGKKIGIKIALGTGRKFMDNLNNAVNEYLNSSEKGRSLTRIGIKYKVKKQTLAKKLKRRNVEIINYQNLTTVNETVFDVIDTEEKAY